MLQPSRPQRSQFVAKLHNLLERANDPEDLRWINEDTFEITSNEARARAALSLCWDFKSLSSFIRQLSYYDFKRLSDRRRSLERKNAANTYIVFKHPSGFFLRGDSSQLDNIRRKTRIRKPDPNRVKKKGSMSNFSAGESGYDDDDDDQYDHEGIPPMPPMISIPPPYPYLKGKYEDGENAGLGWPADSLPTPLSTARSWTSNGSLEFKENVQSHRDKPNLSLDFRGLEVQDWQGATHGGMHHMMPHSAPILAYPPYYAPLPGGNNPTSESYFAAPSQLYRMPPSYVPSYQGRLPPGPPSPAASNSSSNGDGTLNHDAVLNRSPPSPARALPPLAQPAPSYTNPFAPQNGTFVPSTTTAGFLEPSPPRDRRATVGPGTVYQPPASYLHHSSSQQALSHAYHQQQQAALHHRFNYQQEHQHFSKHPTYVETGVAVNSSYAQANAASTYDPAATYRAMRPASPSLASPGLVRGLSQ